MTKFKIDELPPLLKSVHKAQNKWRPRNSSDTISNFKIEIEQILELLNLYNNWKSRFDDTKIAKKMIPEIFMDGFNSLYFSMLGLYKYANMCLRSQLETSLRMIYFIDHEVEYQWWLDDNEWYRSLKQNYVWGSEFTYFLQLEKINQFENDCPSRKKIYSKTNRGLGNLLKLLYGQLSKSIHTSAGSFQTSAGKFSPKYSRPKFAEWIKNCKDLQTYIFISLILAFPDIFKKISTTKQNEILNNGVVDNDYINIIKNII